MIFSAAFVDVIEHIETGGGGGHEDNDVTVGVTNGGESFGFVLCCLDGFFERFSEYIFWFVKIGVEFVARFTDKNDTADMQGFDEPMDFREILIVSFITTAENKDDIAIWKGIEGDFGGGCVSGEIVVKVFDAV